VHRELEVSVLLVVVGFVVLLGLFQAVTDLRKELITLRQLLSHRRNARRARLVRVDGGGGVTAKDHPRAFRLVRVDGGGGVTAKDHPKRRCAQR
jgi:hypothetical protein